MLKVINTSQNVPDVEHPFTFPLDPFQKHALYAISIQENVLVTAKTGSGKTLVGEYQIWNSLRKGKRVFYTTPIKSLSNQKFHDLKTLYPGRVGIMTGDIKFCPYSEIVIMTTEILRNLLFKQNTSTENIGITAELSLEGVDAIIFDEVHYINDPGRGKVWEECFVLVPPSINLVLLSATIHKPEAFAQWLGDLKQKPVHLISTEYRVVPLLYKLPNGQTLMNEKDQFFPKVYSDWFREFSQLQKDIKKHKEKVAGREEGQIVKKEFESSSFVQKMNDMINELDRTNKLPALFFVLSRRLCCEYAKKVTSTLLDSSDTASVKHILSFHLHKFPDVQLSDQYFDLAPLLERGIGFHHSGILPILKEITEILFSRGFIKVLFATETFAVGLNMPTKTVVFTSFRKKSDSGFFRMLRPDEFTQMAGRAGRRGKDTEGLVYYLPQRDPEPLGEIQSMMTGLKPTISSQLDLGYSYILQTVHSGKDILADTLWHKQRLQQIRALEKDIFKKKAEYPLLSETDMTECQKKHEIDEMLKSREKQTLQNAWNNKHVGPKWEIIWTRFQHLKKTEREVDYIQYQIDELRKPPQELSDRTAFLEKIGYMEGGSLTFIGTLASEVHEAHPILMPCVFHSKMWHELSCAEIIQNLSLFLEVPDDDDEASFMIPTGHSAYPLFKKALEFADTEFPKSPDKYWSLSLYWSDLVKDWMDGEPSRAICRTYAIDEGAFVRAILKLRNIVEEWNNLAQISEDMEMLDKMRENSLVRDIVVPDSLYLR
jgi:superfamily II RNA helicase